MNRIMGIGVLVTACGTAMAAERDVQIRSIDVTNRIIELHNYGASDEALDGWRFCSHDESLSRFYTSPAGLNGITLMAGASLFIHQNNDAPGGDPSRINASAVGSMRPIDAGPFGLQIYFAPVVFFDGNTIADHLQWSIGGAGDGIADERNDEAVGGGVWNGFDNWISTAADTGYIRLNDTTGATLHGPKNYSALAAMPDCNENGVDDFFEIADGSEKDVNENGIPDSCESLPGDMNCDGAVSVGDINGFVLAITDAAAYAAMFPDCNIDNADCSGDDTVSVGDINCFVALVTGG